MSLLRMEAITKVYPGVIANQDISLEVRAGEIHALLGENGAGKSTLMKILYGMTTPDNGRILWNDHPVLINTTRDAIRLGIGMVHQHFMLVGRFTAFQNIILHQPTIEKDTRATIDKLCQDYGLEIDLDQPIEGMPLGMQQRVEIVKALYRGARLLILDEPTAVLTPAEVDRLFEILRRLAASDRSVLLIAHKLDEVLAISQRVTVLRDGRQIATLDTNTTTPDGLARLMVGRPVVLSIQRPPAPDLGPREPLIVVEDLHVPPIQGRDALYGLSISVCPGQIVGIAGVDGNGQRALLEAICGVRKASKGRIMLLGQDTSHATARELTNLHVGRIPDDRQSTGLLLDMSVQDNLLLGDYNHPPTSVLGWLRNRPAQQLAERLAVDYNVRTPSVTIPVRKLSGGNQQKVILAREMHDNPPALIVANPTRGLDIGATEYVYQQLLKKRQDGAAILLISSDLEEIFSLSDRIAVVHDGTLMGILNAEDATRDRIGLMMTGILASDAAPQIGT